MNKISLEYFFLTNEIKVLKKKRVSWTAEKMPKDMCCAKLHSYLFVLLLKKLKFLFMH